MSEVLWMFFATEYTMQGKRGPYQVNILITVLNFKKESSTGELLLLHFMLSSIHSSLCSNHWLIIQVTAEGPRLGGIFLHYFKWSGYFYPVLTWLKEAMTMFTKIYHHDTYCCLETFTLAFWLKHPIWHVLPSSFGKCHHIKHTPARLAPYAENHYYIFKNWCRRAVKNYKHLYGEMT